jgi:hypothetical protein
MAWDFLQLFYGTPLRYYNDYSIEYVIRCEATHFLFSAFMGFAVASVLMQTISSHNRWGWQDRYIYRFSFWWGLFAAILVHIIIDTFTQLA